MRAPGQAVADGAPRALEALGARQDAELTILGGGPAGLAVAYYAQRAGLRPLLLERSGELGGLCRTLSAGPHRYDTGAHRFHDRDAEVTADVRELLGGELRPVDAPSQIYDRGRFIDFPPTPLNLLRSCGLREGVRIGAELVRSRFVRAARDSFADFAIGQFGETLARRLLLNHAEKLWGLPAAELSPDVATRRLQGMSLRSLLLELVSRGRRVEHIDGSFLYPRLGYGQIAERMAATLPSSALRLRHEVSGLDCDGRVVRAIAVVGQATVVPRGPIVSTLPLPLVVRLLGASLGQAARDAARALRFRHLRVIFLRLAVPRVSRNASIYFPEPQMCVARVSEPRNRSREMAPDGETSLVAEVPCFLDDAVQQLDDAVLAARVVDELTAARLIAPAQVIEWRHHFLPNAYPVYARDYAEHVAVLRRALAPIENLIPLGRNGLFFYSHLHDQLRLARNAIAEVAPVGRFAAAAAVA